MRYSYDRTAASPGTLMDAKLEWALGIANLMVDRFENYGGWRAFKVRVTTKVIAGSHVTLEVRSDEYGWTGHVAIYVEKAVFIRASILVDKAAKKTEDVDLLKLLQEVDDESETFKVQDSTPPHHIVMDVSLFFSRTLNPLLE